MVRKDTNKQYSLRKLKTGTTSVAVALTVLGAGLTVNQTEVSARVTTRSQAQDAAGLKEKADKYEVRNHELEHNNEKLKTENSDLKTENSNLKTENSKLTSEKEELTQEKEDLTQEKQRLTRENRGLTSEKEDLTQKNRELTKEKEELSKQKETLGLALDKTIDEKIKSDNDHKKEIGELKGSNKIS
ncbi:TPA: YSIRK-type signal peptide-containing protein, partial [Streptococcus pyogenes]